MYVGNGDVAVTGHIERMNLGHILGGRSICDDGTLCNFPAAVEHAAAVLIDTDADAVEVEVGELAVSVGTAIDSAVCAEGENTGMIKPRLYKLTFSRTGTLKKCRTDFGKKDMKLDMIRRCSRWKL